MQKGVEQAKRSPRREKEENKAEETKVYPGVDLAWKGARCLDNSARGACAKRNQGLAKGWTAKGWEVI